MKNNKKKVGKIQLAVLFRTIIPMAVMGLIIIIVTYSGYQKSIKNEINNSLLSVASSVAGAYDEISPGNYVIVGEKILSLYKGDKNISGWNSLIDRVKKETGMDITLFYQDVRFLTTLRDMFGARYTGTGIHGGILNEVKNSNKASYFQVDIDGTLYYSCYLPLYNSDSSFVGMIAAAIPAKKITNEALATSLPIIVVTIISVIFASLISFNYTNAIANSIMKIRKFLGNMVDGKLDNEMPRDVLLRQDELAETGKSVVDMQNAIRVLVERDPLTGLYNRRYGGARLRNLQKHANQSGMPYAICMCDIDFFKRVNDTYSHEAGDIVLKKVADIMRKAMAGKGFVARWGGEEFLLIFDKDDITGATTQLHSILDTVRKTEIPYGSTIIRITMSFGVVNGDQSNDYGALLRHADERLYWGKTHGRNQVVSVDHSEDEEVNATVSSVSAPKDAADNHKNDVPASSEAHSEEHSESSASNATADNSSDEKVAKTSSVSSKESSSSDSKDNSDDEVFEKFVQKMAEMFYNKTMEDFNDKKGSSKDNND